MCVIVVAVVAVVAVVTVVFCGGALLLPLNLLLLSLL